MKYAIHYRDAQTKESDTIEASSMEEAWEIAKDEAEEWASEGEWGNEGAIIVVWYGVDDEPEERIEVYIPPDTAALIAAAGGDADCDHVWSSEGEGGCRENPGVWSVGGTAIVCRSHCVLCGLKKTERFTGSQRNPGEHDTVEFCL